MNALANEAEAEVGVARAATRHGIVQVLSTFASRSIEDVAAVGGQCWFQLYVFPTRSITLGLVRRAEAAGCTALVVTVDVPVFGLRTNLDRVGFETPPHIKLAHFVGTEGAKDDELIKSVTTQVDASLTWSDVEWLKNETKMKIVLKVQLFFAKAGKRR